ncbi:MAG: phosphatidate cytidylyltransferase [Anaerolineales bacterium]|nr:phosphatidate cytidylyltransferase [Anaerolineales bacterium]
MLNNNIIALLITFTISLVWLRINDFFAHKGWISSHISRKIIHMGTGLLFVLCWLLFNDDPLSRYLATLVPFVITIQFLLVGTGIIKDDAAVKAMSRSGDRREILRGPLFYGIIFIIITLFYWKDSAIGITALMLLCGGDGFADILGRKFGKKPLPWAKNKTWMGSLGMFLGGWVFSTFILAIYTHYGVLLGTISTYIFPITLVTFIGTVTESLPLKDIDNITVTLISIIAGIFLFP